MVPPRKVSRLEPWRYSSYSSNIPQVYAGWGGFVMEQVTEIARFKAMLRFMLILATPASIDGSWPLISRDYNHAQAELR